MPAKCTILNCGATAVRNPHLTFHKLPQSKSRKQIWLNHIGENIRPDLKHVFLCSLHFDESAFNRTMEIIRLRDDAVPTRFPRPTTLHKPAAAPGKQCIEEHSYTVQAPTPTRRVEDTHTHCNFKLKEALDTVKELKDRVCRHEKKIKCLREGVRRRDIRIDRLNKQISELFNNRQVAHENCIPLDGCAGPKDFLLRQIKKAKGAPLDKEYSEEIRQFAVTLHSVSPKAYEFVRASYDSCLPHPRTLSKWYKHMDETGFEQGIDPVEVEVETSNV